MRYRHLITLAATAFALVAPGTAAAAPSGTIQVAVEPKAELVGDSARVSVRVKCAPFGQHFESHVTVTQDDNAIFAQPSLPVVTCDGRWHTFTVLATPFEGSFHRGRARASAYVSRVDPVTGDIREGNAVRTIRIR